MFKRNKLSAIIALVAGLTVLPVNVMADDDDDSSDDDKKSFVLTGNVRSYLPIAPPSSTAIQRPAT